MNRPYSRHRYRNGLLNGRGSLAAVLIFIAIIVIVAVRFAAPGILSSLTRPMWGIGSSLTAWVHGTATSESKSQLRADKDQLSAQNAELAAQNSALASQVSDLTALLGSRTEPEKGIVARVLARPPVAPYDVLIIDQGESAGVSVGAQARGPGGTPIGTVGETDATQSRVALYSTSGLQNDGWVGATHIPVTLTGAGAGAFHAEVPKQAGVAVGDPVYISSASTFPVGTVVQIEVDPSSPSVELDVHPYTNPFSLTWVTVAR
jgi:cell shape-determining protein MreC